VIEQVWYSEKLFPVDGDNNSPTIGRHFDVKKEFTSNSEDFLLQHISDIIAFYKPRWNGPTSTQPSPAKQPENPKNRQGSRFQWRLLPELSYRWNAPLTQVAKSGHGFFVSYWERDI